MPNQNNQNQTNDSQQTPTQTGNTPPVVPDFMSSSVNSPSPSQSQYSAGVPLTVEDTQAPPESFDITPNPSKKFGGKKIIATILGVLVLAGGILGGVVLTRQNQDVREQAADSCSTHKTASECQKSCSPKKGKDDKSYECSWSSKSQSCGESAQECGGGGGGGTGPVGGGGRNDNLKECTNEQLGTYGLSGSLPAKCSSLNSKTCQKDNGGNNTGYECICIDLSPGVCKFYANNCTTLNLKDCKPGGGSSSTGGNYENSSPGTCVNSDGTGTTQCSRLDACHCQGGESCQTVKCEPEIRESCLKQGRAWCGQGSGATCCVQGYKCGPNSYGCVLVNPPTNPPKTNPPKSTPPPTVPPTPTPPPGTAMCVDVKAYTETWALLSANQLAQLKPNNKVNFCVRGSTSQGTFDKAKFTINGVAQAETITKRPSSDDYCQLYTIPSGTTSFNITAQIHHPALGWK